MLLLATVAILLLVGAIAVLASVAASAAERAIGLVAAERRRDHWRRVGEAGQDVETAALAYRRSMEESLDRNGGDGAAAARESAVRASAERYREASRRFGRTLAGGPRPPRSATPLALLLDERHPEAVAAARPADDLLRVVMGLQEALDRPAEDGDHPAGDHRFRWGRPWRATARS